MNEGTELTLKKQYGVIDILRLIFAVSVVFMHRAGSMKNEFLFQLLRNGISELAVPFFLVASGFFFFRKFARAEADIKKKQILTDYVKRLGILYLIWSLIYLIPTFYRGLIREGKSVSEIVIGFVNDILIGGSSFWHLWYVQALIVSIVFICFCLKKIPPDAMLIISCFLYLIYSLSTYCVILKNNVFLYGIFSWINSNVFPSVFLPIFRLPIFLMAGKLAAENKIQFSKAKSAVFFFGFYICFIGFGILRIYNGDLGQLLQEIISPAVLFFLYKICTDIRTEPKAIYVKMRNMSALIYFSHWFFLEEFLEAVLGILGFDPGIAYKAWFKFGITMMYSVSFSLLVMWLSKNGKFKFLKYLY